MDRQRIEEILDEELSKSEDPDTAALGRERQEQREEDDALFQAARAARNGYAAPDLTVDPGED